MPDDPPYTTGAKAMAYKRPVYPFPYVARYNGKGDVGNAASYMSIRGPPHTPQTFVGETASLIGTDNQKFYKAAADGLVVVPAPTTP